LSLEKREDKSWFQRGGSRRCISARGRGQAINVGGVGEKGLLLGESVVFGGEQVPSFADDEKGGFLKKSECASIAQLSND